MSLMTLFLAEVSLSKTDEGGRPYYPPICEQFPYHPLDPGSKPQPIHNNDVISREPTQHESKSILLDRRLHFFGSTPRQLLPRDKKKATRGGPGGALVIVTVPGN